MRPGQNVQNDLGRFLHSALFVKVVHGGVLELLLVSVEHFLANDVVCQRILERCSNIIFYPFPSGERRTYLVDGRKVKRRLVVTRDAGHYEQLVNEACRGSVAENVFVIEIFFELFFYRLFRFLVRDSRVPCCGL